MCIVIRIDLKSLLLKIPRWQSDDRDDHEYIERVRYRRNVRGPHHRTAAMPSIEETKRQVKASLRSQQQQPHDIDHDAILAGLWDEIDSHNDRNGEPHVPARHRARHDESRQERVEYDSNRESGKRTSKFRFKDGQEPRKRKRTHPSEDDREHRRRKHRSKHRRERSTDREQAEEAAHPFPREPTDPDRDSHENSSAAFRESLFDALADDEGAAYWESVYSQPIHMFPRPKVQNARGELEEMNDDQYALHVQTKMWEKKNPHIVLERERKLKQRREEEEEKTRQREEFIRKKSRAAWEREQNNEGAKKFAGVGSNYEYIFEFDEETKSSAASKYSTTEQHEYRHAWKQYLDAWDQLKLELAKESEATSSTPPKEASPSKRIPWPVIRPKPVIKPNIEDFMRHMPLEEDGPSREQMLKAERVRWHPDKVQQRFRGEVDEGTMKIVTGVFQVVDALLEAERKPKR